MTKNLVSSSDDESDAGGKSILDDDDIAVRSEYALLLVTM